MEPRQLASRLLPNWRAGAFVRKKPALRGCAHSLGGTELGHIGDCRERETMIDRIAEDPTIHFAEPHVVGTRVTIQNVLELVENEVSFERIIQDYYPDLKIEDIQACLRYAIALDAEGLFEMYVQYAYTLR